MKVTQILLTAIVTLTFTATANAEGFKLKMCERAETSFWDTIQSANSSADQSYLESIDAKGQVTYYKKSLGKIELSINEVRKRCKGVASKDILDAYEKKKSEIQGKLNAL